MAEYDLTAKMVPYLDRHLTFPLLEFLSINEIYNSTDVTKAKYDLLSKTNMVDFTAKLYKELNSTEEVPEEFIVKREKVLSNLEELNKQAQKVMDVIENPEVISALRQDKEFNLKFLNENHDFDAKSIETLYKFGQFQFSCGNYGGCSEMLYHFQVLSVDDNLLLSSLWGRLASEILTGNWDNAFTELQKVKDSIETNRDTSSIHQLHQRTFLIHWSLFVFFNHQKGKEYLLDLFFQPQYINTIQTSCPWILRYISAAAIINRRRKNVIKDLIKIVQQEAHAYNDPITQFTEALYVRFDFDEAQSKLKECENLFANDFFLVSSLDEFLENARTLILEAYCRINQRINITQLAKLLNLSPEEGEKWIVNLIRDARVDAKIDFNDNSVVMNPINTSIYRQMIEKTRDAVFQTQIIANGIEKRDNAIADVNKDQSKAKNNSNRRHNNKEAAGAHRQGQTKA
ncbi:eukaryotic translation initiation factor 3, subunit 6 [Neoconidiobolus thromboides FSU 785]|nr:eukaryotic translation initiation factor 3, subunit 6 [Neoconidiobolus thromboides FSU 785]